MSTSLRYFDTAIAAFLVSADSDYITGQVIMADGGMVLV
jgi:NAD(P)-dependent dehydrogenase (short-subunit alcohol dehydrogenase family)